MPKIFDYSKKPVLLENITKTWEACFKRKFNAHYFNWRFLNNPNEKKVFIEYLIENNMSDFVAIGRGHLADPDWANKAKSGTKVIQYLDIPLFSIDKK